MDSHAYYFDVSVETTVLFNYSGTMGYPVFD